MASNRCPSCGSAGMQVFYELDRAPVHSVLLLATREEALDYPVGRISLGFCDTCGFISNMAYDPGSQEYLSNEYESTQGFSSTFKGFHHQLASRLVEDYDLHGKQILEIGCGQGEFLTTLCELGANRGTGFDPAYVQERRTGPDSNQVTFIKDFYSEKYAELYADFVVCKMTLEHIHNTYEFLATVRRSIGDRQGTIVYFQVPDATRILKDVAFWDIYYEHCSYFSPGSCSRLFQRCGFEVLHLGQEYDGQYLTVEARPAAGHQKSFHELENDLELMREYVSDFSQRFSEQRDLWRKRIQETKQQGKSAVIWGGGSKGVAFLTTLKIQEEIEFAVDVNPYKHGTYLAGTGQKVIAPADLKEIKPDVIIVMNPIYCREIEQDLKRIGVTACLLPVS